MGPNEIEQAIQGLEQAISDHPDHVYSDSFRETLGCLIALAVHIRPEHRFLSENSLRCLQDLAYEATKVARK